MLKHIPGAIRICGAEHHIVCTFRKNYAEAAMYDHSCTLDELYNAASMLEDTVSILCRVCGKDNPRTKRYESVLDRTREHIAERTRP